MTRIYCLLAAVGLATAACSGGSEQTAGNSSSQTDATEVAGAPVERPEMMAGAAGADGIVPGGAVDVLRRDGWRVESVQQADASTAGETEDSAG